MKFLVEKIGIISPIGDTELAVQEVNLNMETWRHPIKGSSGHGPMDGPGGWRTRFPVYVSKSYHRVGTESASRKHVLHEPIHGACPCSLILTWMCVLTFIP